MGPDAVAQVSRPDPAPHRERDQVDQLLGVDAEQRRADEQPGVRVDDELDQPVRLTDDLGPGHGRDVRDRLGDHVDVETRRPRLRRGQPDPGQRRGQERRRGDSHAVRRAAGACSGELVQHDAVVVVGDVGELGPAVDVADSEDALGRGSQLLVDRDEAAAVHVHPGRREVEAVGRRGPTGGHEDRVRLDRTALVQNAHL